MLGSPKPRRLNAPITASLEQPDPPRGRLGPHLNLRLGDPVAHAPHQPPAAVPWFRSNRQPYDALGKRRLSESLVPWIVPQPMAARGGRPFDRGGCFGAARAHPRHRGNPLAAAAPKWPQRWLTSSPNP